MNPDLLAPWVPDGFDDFWAETCDKVGQPILTIGDEAPGASETHGVRTLTLQSSSGMVLHGWLAVPPGNGPFPCFLWVPPYSRWSMLPNQYGTRPGYVSMSLNLFGESAFHQEVYRPERGYFAEGIDQPETWVFRRLFIDCALALAGLRGLPMVDPARMASMGMSQGGGLSVWLGAFAKGLQGVVADMPFLAGGRAILSAKFYRYPLKEIFDFVDGDSRRFERVLRTVSYFDTVNVATRCRVPTLVTAGTKDPSVRPAQAEAVYNALAGPKEYELLDWGHDWHPSMVNRNHAWLDRWTCAS